MVIRRQNKLKEAMLFSFQRLALRKRQNQENARSYVSMTCSKEMNLDLSVVYHSNARRLNEMKTFLLLLLLFVSGPLLCEENSLLGYRLVWNNSKGKVTYLHLKKIRKKGFSLSIHPFQTKPIRPFSKLTTTRNLHFPPKRYSVRSL